MVYPMLEDIWMVILDNSLVRFMSDEGEGSLLRGLSSMSLNDLTIIVKYQSSDAPA